MHATYTLIFKGRGRRLLSHTHLRRHPNVVAALPVRVSSSSSRELFEVTIDPRYVNLLTVCSGVSWRKMAGGSGVSAEHNGLTDADLHAKVLT